MNPRSRPADFLDVEVLHVFSYTLSFTFVYSIAYVFIFMIHIYIYYMYVIDGDRKMSNPRLNT